MNAALPQQPDDALDRLVRHVVNVMKPVEVWLFGSRAEQRARATSDYDLLVVMPDGTPDAIEPVTQLLHRNHQ